MTPRMKTCLFLYAVLAVTYALSGNAVGSIGIGAPITMSRQFDACQVEKYARIRCGDVNVTMTECESINCCWETVEALDDSPQCFVTAVPTTYLEHDHFVTSTNNTERLCHYKDHDAVAIPYLADFNDDRSDDVLCRIVFMFSDINREYDVITTINYHKSGGIDYESPDFYEGRGQFCIDIKDHFIVGDVDDDDMADLVCVKQNGAVEVKKSFVDNPGHNHPTNFTSVITVNDAGFGFCTTPSSKVYVGDFDGDSLQDLLCLCKHSSCKGSRRHLAKGTSSGGFLVPVRDPNFGKFCSDTDDKLHVADFDKDDRDDLICEKPNGKYQIALTDGDGLLVNIDWSESRGWCGSTGDKFFVGNFNGDRSADLMCHLANKTICLRYNSHIFNWKDMFEQQYCTPKPWCETGTIQIADYNGDHYDDIFCFEIDGNFRVSLTRRPTAMVRFVDYDFSTPHNIEPFCANTDIQLGDINGDNRQDLLCHNNLDGIPSVKPSDQNGHPLYDRYVVFDYLKFCYRNSFYPEPPVLLFTDVNGDRWFDFVCHSSEDGSVTVAYASPTEFLNFAYTLGLRRLNDVSRKSDILPLIFCKNKGVTVFSADLDGDSKFDLICLYEVTGDLYFLRSEGLKFAESPQFYHNFCAGTDKKLLFGNFNTDNLQDIMCHNRTTGVSTFLMSKNTFGTFEDIIFTHDPFCGEIATTGANVYVGDYNGDGLWDIACHNATGKVTLRYNHGVKDRSITFADEWTWNNSFCRGNSVVMSSDTNGDGLWDLICNSPSDSYILIAEGHYLVEHNPAGLGPMLANQHMNINQSGIHDPNMVDDG